MFRDELAADHGMLFVHEREEPQAYWMKNTQDPARHPLLRPRRASWCRCSSACRPARWATSARPSRARARRCTCSNSTPAPRRRWALKAGDELKFGPAHRRAAQVALDLRRRRRPHCAHARSLRVARLEQPRCLRRRRTPPPRHRAADRARRVSRPGRRRLRRAIQGYADALKPKLGGDIDLPATLTDDQPLPVRGAGLRRQQHAVRRPAQQLLERGLRPQARHPDLAGGGADRTDAPARPAARRHLLPGPLPGAPAGRRRHPGDGPVQQGPPGQRGRTEGARLAAPGRAARPTTCS